MPFRIDVLRSTAELERLAPEWAELWERDAQATPFQHPAWLIPWWRHFGQPDLRLVTLRQSESGTLVAMVPLYIYCEPTTGERQLLLLGAGTSDYLDAVVSPECGVDDLAASLDAAFEADEAWDVAYLTQLRPESPLPRALAQLRSVEFDTFAGEGTSRCPASPISGLPAKVRREVLFCRNAAIAHGKLDLVQATGEGIRAAFDGLVAMHTARWQQKREAGVLADPAVLRWHREALPLLETAGLLRLMTLRLEGAAIATMYSMIDSASRSQRTQYLYLMGFALEWEALQPGRLLTAYTVERAANEGVRMMDMLRGEEAYKRFWHTEPRSTLGYALRRRSE